MKGKAETTGAVDNEADPKAKPTPSQAEPKAAGAEGQAVDHRQLRSRRLRAQRVAVKSTADDKAPAAKSTTNEKAAPAAGSSAQGTQAPAATSTAQGSATGRRVGQPDDGAEDQDPHHGAAVEQRAEGVAEPDQLQHQRRHRGAAQGVHFVAVPRR